MNEFTVIVTVEFQVQAIDPYDAAVQILADLSRSGRAPAALKTEVTSDG